MTPAVDHAGIADHHAVVGHIEVDIGVGCDQDVGTDVDAAHDHRIGAHPDIVAQHGAAGIFSAFLSADGGAFAQITIPADDCAGIDIDVMGVSEVQTLADLIRQDLQAIFSAPAEIAQGTEDAALPIPEKQKVAQLVTQAQIQISPQTPIACPSF